MMTIRRLLGCLSAVLLFAVFASAAFAEPPLGGTYRAEGETAGGMAYGGQVGIEPDGKGVSLAWGPRRRRQLSRSWSADRQRAGQRLLVRRRTVQWSRHRRLPH